MHQTALKYDTKVSDGGRLELKTPQENAKPVRVIVRESPDDLSDLAEASESAPGLWDDPIDDPGLERLPDWAGQPLAGFAVWFFLIIGGMAGEQKENRRIVTLKWCVAE